MLTSPLERKRHHSVPSKQWPTDANAVITSIQHRCRQSLIWCQSHLQANYTGFTVIIFLFLLRWIFFWHFSTANHLETICLKRLRTARVPYITWGLFQFGSLCCLLYFFIFIFIFLNKIGQIQSLCPWISARFNSKGHPKVSWLKGLWRWF